MLRYSHTCVLLHKRLISFPFGGKMACHQYLFVKYIFLCVLVFIGLKKKKKGLKEGIEDW